MLRKKEEGRKMFIKSTYSFFLSFMDSLFSEDLLGEVDYLLAAEVLQFFH